MHLAVKRMKMILLENLVEAQAPLNVKERSTGKTPLHLAVENNDSDTVDILLQVCLSIIFIVRLVQYRVTDTLPRTLDLIEVHRERGRKNLSRIMTR